MLLNYCKESTVSLLVGECKNDLSLGVGFYIWVSILDLDRSLVGVRDFSLYETIFFWVLLS